MQADLSRRNFLAAAGSAAAIAAMPRVSSSAPSDRVVMGMIGVGSQGTGRLREFLDHDDVRIGAICDVDRRHLDRAIALVEKEKGYKPQAFDDFRGLLESKEIDAVAIVTPDHWHAIPTVSAFEAGK